MGYEHVFRVTIVEFPDRHKSRIGRVKRSSIHSSIVAGTRIVRIANESDQ